MAELDWATVADELGAVGAPLALAAAEATELGSAEPLKAAEALGAGACAVAEAVEPGGGALLAPESPDAASLGLD